MTALCLGALPAFAQEKPPESFRIDAQPLQKALVKYSEQSRTVIVAPAELLEGKRSSAVGGDLTANEALATLLKGTGLVPQQDTSGALTLKLATTGAEAQTDPVPFLIAATEAPDQEPQAAAGPTADGNERDIVVVTGTRGKPRSIIDSPTPIDVFSAEEINQGSPTGVFESLRFLVPSFNLPTRAGGGTATIIATGGLRGLNPDQTLVLVNGKRRHKTALINSVSALYNGAAGVDLNMIPSSAIARIEVLRDGAAAQYGSDAIAGVINIILKDNASGGDASVSYGQNFDLGDGQYTTASVNQGASLGDAGFANLSYSFMDRDSSNRAVPIASTVNLFPLLPGGVRDPREASIDRLVTKNYGSMPQVSHTFGANVGYEINGLELYGFATYGARESVLNWSYRAPNNIATLPEVYPFGFRPRLTILEDDYEVAGGVRGAFDGWDWDVSSNFGSDITDWENTNGLNPSLGPASPVFFEVGRLISSEWVNSIDITKPFALNGAGELQVSFGAQHRWENYKVEQGDDASWAAGTYRRPAGQVGAGQLQAPGAQATPGFRPDDVADAERVNLNTYAELGWTPNEKVYLGGAVRYEDFDDAAGDTVIYKVNGRYELLDWLAARASYNTGFRAPTLAQQAYSSTTSQFRDLDGDGVAELVLLKNLPVNSPAAVALGSTPLVPEESKNISVGFTATPFDNFTLTIDAYQIDVDDRIAVTSTFSPLDTRASATPGVTVGQQIQAILVANGLSPEVSGQYYTNAIDTQTKGVDVVATYRIDTDAFGDFDFNVGYNVNETEITGIIDNPPELAALGPIVIFDRGKQGSISDSIPDSKITISTGWKFGAFSADLRGTRFGTYTSRNATNAAADFDVEAEWIADLELSYRLTDAFTIYAGANNIFNTYPEQINPPGATDGSNMYNTLAPFGFTGGSWYLRGTFKW
ncbi:MAG: TonB-dependent receptor [Hyphomonadaceae bacterium]|nr:TonB-dependent receptor [Hyphomonadaceae bacterium]